VIFLDANVFMYATGTESPYREPCRRILTTVVHASLPAVTNTEVIQEILYRYHRAGQAALAVQRAREACALVSTVLPVEADDLSRAMTWLQRHRTLGVRDAIHAASALRWRCEQIVSADRGFDVLDTEGVTRIDPQAFARGLTTT
jgi:predicted nucleic acid-binding protein